MFVNQAATHCGSARLDAEMQSFMKTQTDKRGGGVDDDGSTYGWLRDLPREPCSKEQARLAMR
jgi:hypothetical protein